MKNKYFIFIILSNLFIIFNFVTLTFSKIIDNSTISSLTSFYEKGLHHYNEGEYELSLVFFEKAFLENPVNSRLYFYLGNIYNHKQMFKKSIEAYKRGLEISTEEEKEKFLINLGRSYQANKQYKQALRVYRLLENKSMLYPELYLYRGIIHFKLKNKIELIKSWQTYLAKKPYNPQYKSIRLALNFMDKNKFLWSNKLLKVSENVQEENKKILESKSEVENKNNKNNEKNSIDEKIKKIEEELLMELESSESNEIDREIEKSILNIKIESENLNVDDIFLKKEGEDYEDIER